MPLAVPHAVQQPSPVERAIVQQINRVRRSHGLNRVVFSRRLHRVARRHSLQMLLHDSLSHDSFTGTSFLSRLSGGHGRGKFGETLAWTPTGAGGAGKIVNLWMNSAPHRAVLLDGRLRRVGVGRVLGQMGAQAGAAVTADWSS
jgi:uncharacterized protein YkwD